METVEQQLIVRFLLGDLSEDNRLRLEERIFRDDAFHEQVTATQEELADDYVQEKLSTKQREQFEEYFLRSPRRRERVEFATAFSRALSPAQPSAATARATAPWWESLAALFRPRLVLAASAAVLALVLATSWLLLENRRLSSRIEEAKAARDSSIRQSQANEADAERRIQELNREITALRAQGSETETKVQQKEQELKALQRTMRSTQPQPSTSVIASFILSPGLTRGTDEPEKLIISAKAQSIHFQLDLEREESYQSYVAEIRTAGGHLVWANSGLKLQPTTYGHAVSLTIPAKLVSTGEYEIALKGAARGKLEAVGYYYFLALKN